MRGFLLRPIVASAALVFLAGCMDDKYDLSDIDTNVRFNVDNLVIPVNIDQITLGDILEPSDEVQVIDGVYTYVTDGDFHSEAIRVEQVSVNIPAIAPANFTIMTVAGAPAPGTDVSYHVSNVEPSSFEFKAENISEDILDLRSVYADTKLEITIDLTALNNVTRAVTLNNVKLQLPKGLVYTGQTQGASYDPATGVYSLAQLQCSTSAPTVHSIPAAGLGIAAGEFDAAAHALNVSGSMNLIEAEFLIKKGDFLSGTTPQPQYSNIMILYHIDDFIVNSVDGTIKYDVDNINIPQVELGDLPDVLSQPGTNLVIKTPKLYLNVLNPLNAYKLHAVTGFEIRANRENEPSNTYAIDNGTFAIGLPWHESNEYNFCLTPAAPQKDNPDYPGSQFVPFTQLSDVLSGDGLPSTIDILLPGTQIPAQDVERFALGVDYPAVEGRYSLLAPLDLGAGSVIKYSDVVDGWSSEDLDKLTITTLEVNLNITTDIPANIDFTGYPIDVDGNKINNVDIVGATIEAMAKDKPVSIKITGEVRNLDGIVFEAFATVPTENGDALSPDMTLTLTNLRPVVSGYYDTEL